MKGEKDARAMNFSILLLSKMRKRREQFNVRSLMRFEPALLFNSSSLGRKERESA